MNRLITTSAPCPFGNGEGGQPDIWSGKWLRALGDCNFFLPEANDIAGWYNIGGDGNPMPAKLRILLPASGLLLAAGTSSASSLNAGIERVVLQQQDFPDDTYRTVTVRVTIARGATVARHTHPGVEMAYIVSGRGEIAMARRPARIVTAGDSFAVPVRTAHTLRNVGGEALVVVSTYVVDKTQPISTPAP